VKTTDLLIAANTVCQNGGTPGSPVGPLLDIVSSAQTLQKPAGAREVLTLLHFRASLGQSPASRTSRTFQPDAGGPA
jgi:hypothetical protein